nr:hypothetical protein Iba_chr03aCG6360 [Ipomoea batatas]
MKDNTDRIMEVFSALGKCNLAGFNGFLGSWGVDYILLQSGILDALRQGLSCCTSHVADENCASAKRSNRIASIMRLKAFISDDLSRTDIWTVFLTQQSCDGLVSNVKALRQGLSCCTSHVADENCASAKRSNRIASIMRLKAFISDDDLSRGIYGQFSAAILPIYFVKLLASVSWISLAIDISPPTTLLVNLCFFGYGLENNTSISKLEELIKGRLSCGGDDFKRAFVLYYLSNFLTPTANSKVDFTAVKSLVNVGEILLL